MGKGIWGCSSLVGGYMRRQWRGGYLQHHASPTLGISSRSWYGPWRRCTVNTNSDDMHEYTSLIRSMSTPLHRFSLDSKAHHSPSGNRLLASLELKAYIDYMIRNPYLDLFFPVVKEYDESDGDKELLADGVLDVYRVMVEIHGDAKGNLPGGEGYLSGKIYVVDDSNHYAYVYKQDAHSGQHIKGQHELLMTANPNNHHFMDCYGPTYLCVDLIISTTTNHNLMDTGIPHLYHCFPPDPRFKYLYKNKTHVSNAEEVDDFEKHKYVRIANLEGSIEDEGYFRFHKHDCLYFLPYYDYVDKVQTYTLTSKDDMCSVSIMFALYSDAFQAHVEVVWLEGENNSGTGLYGLIAAKADISDDDDGEFETFLFLKHSSESVQVISGEAIELLRSLIAIPVQNKLVIRAHLRCGSKLIPAAKLTFPSKKSGTSELTVNGIYKVKVTWDRFFKSPK